MADITLKAGDSLYWQGQFQDQIGTAIDITGYSIKCQGKSDPISGEFIFDLTTANSGITITDAVNGQYLIRQNDTTTFPVGTYYVDIEFTNPSGLVTSTRTFELQIDQDVTR